MPLADALYRGGINLNNMKEYLNCGVCGFGIGSNIYEKEMLDNNDYEAIACLAEKICCRG